MATIIPAVPTAPSSANKATFPALADAIIAWLASGTAAMNAQSAENNVINENVNAKVAAALTAGLGNAATNAQTATDKAAIATDKAAVATDKAAIAVAAANAAVATSGLPDMTGKGGQFMRANAAGTGFELTPGGTLPRVARTANTVLALADIGKWIDCTGTFAQTFSASAALVTGWWCRITNTGTGLITLTPNGAELIDGAATRTLYPGERRLMQCDGLTIRTVESIGGGRRAIFSTSAAAVNASSNLERIENAIVTPVSGYSSASIAFASNGTNLVASGKDVSYGFIGSSPDGRTWTNRAAPVASYWIPLSDGAGFIAYTWGGGLSVAVSATGTSWAAAAALPGAVNGSSNIIAAGTSAGRYALIGSATTTTIYLTTNSATSWTTQASPVVSPSLLLSCGGLFVLSDGSATTYYTSSTGLTGSWTARTCPTSSADLRIDFDGSMLLGGGTSLWRSTDAVTWVQLAIPALTGGQRVLTINGVGLSGVGATAFGFGTLHNGKWVYRTAGLGTAFNTNNSAIGRLGSACLLSTNSSGQAALIDPTATDATTGLFD